MNKKGFTMVEIIMCIGVLAIVGVASILGINYVSNNIRISKLKDIEDEIMLAARIYMETHDEVDYHLNKNNTMILPLNVLVNEGLLDLSTTELDVEDVGKEYIIAALTRDDKDGTCVNITDGSWNLSKDSTLYICADSNGNSNLSIIDPSQTSNANKVMKEPYIFKGEDPNNYIKYTKNGVHYNYRIYYIDTDDSMVLVSDNSFGNVFDGKTDNLCGIPSNPSHVSEIPWIETDEIRLSRCEAPYNIEFYKSMAYEEYCTMPKHKNYESIVYEKERKGYMLNNECPKTDKQEKLIGLNDVVLTKEEEGNFIYSPFAGQTQIRAEMYTYLNKYFDVEQVHTLVNSTQYLVFKYTRILPELNKLHEGGYQGYKIHLKSCMKIKSGTGNIATPYILEDKC